MTWKRTPQGYVITTATITRAGPIEYYGHEVGLTGSDANKKITVIRTLDELSKPETLASFNAEHCATCFYLRHIPTYPFAALGQDERGHLSQSVQAPAVFPC